MFAQVAMVDAAFLPDQRGHLLDAIHGYGQGREGECTYGVGPHRRTHPGDGSGLAQVREPFDYLALAHADLCG